jgi:pimeloyl-ACP methyl ester carboxylesterase
MYVNVNGAATYCYSAGKAYNPEQPTLIFIHGVLNDHSVWILQSRYFAHHGWNVLAVDLPGHCRSAGQAPQTVQEAAQFIVALLDACQIGQATLVGHSFGALVALEAAGLAPQRVRHLVMVGVAYPMKVSPALLETARQQPDQAIAMVNVFSRATLAAPPSVLGPGTWVHAASSALGKRVLQSNPAVNLLYTGLQACDRYANGENAIEALDCPVLFILGSVDQMTPVKAAQSLIAKTRHPTVRILPGGHHQMAETPHEMLHALTTFLPCLTP